MDLINAMQAFVKVNETGSFTAAAQHLGISTAQTSRAITELENILKARLMQRTTRSRSLTQVGARYLERCRDILALIDDATLEAGEACQTASGCLRVHAVTEFGLECLMPLVPDYTRLYPQVTLDLTLERRRVNLVQEQFDMTIALSRHLPDSEMVAQPLGSFSGVLCAAPQYLQRHGVPESLGDLGRHTCLRLALPQRDDTWVVQGPCGEERVEPGATFRVNLSDALLSAAVAGMGVCLLPSFIAAGALKAGTLQRVLPAYAAHERKVYALYSSRRFVDAKIKSWIDFLQARMPGQLSSANEVMDDPRYWSTP
ncbi:LysR family transcriptional regulator [Pseudomonas putida]